MPHWKLTLAYNGAGFHGWQVQPDLPTIQGTLAEALRHLTGETVLPQGAGRTDTGVHALAQVASVTLVSPLPPQNLQRALNRILPAAIRILSAEIVPATFHARHSARGKRYEYRIFERRHRVPGTEKPQERVCSPFLSPFVWDCRWPLDLNAMQAAAGHLLGTHDFTSMAASSRNFDLNALSAAAPTGEFSEEPPDSANGSDLPLAPTPPNPVKTIHTAGFLREDHLLTFRIHGSGFLHHMVRNLVGTLVDVGRGSLSPDDLPKILASRDRSQAGPTAPASGLFLAEVVYPPEPEAAIAQHDLQEVAP